VTSSRFENDGVAWVDHAERQMSRSSQYRVDFWSQDPVVAFGFSRMP
jgi:hypothetical protein